MEDTEIISLYWARDARAIDETDKKYRPYLTGISMNILANESDAEECVNDTYLASWNAMPPHRPDALRAFLGKLTRRISLNRHRSAASQKRGGGQVPLALEELSECLADSSDTARTVEQTELVRALDDFLDSVPERRRAVFVRRYWHLDSLDAIAERTRMSQSGVKASLRRTRKELHDYLTKEGWI